MTFHQIDQADTLRSIIEKIVNTKSIEKTAKQYPFSKAADDKIQVSGVRVMRIDHLAMANPDYYNMAIIPIAGTDDYYTVEVRKPTGYDVKLPAKAVIIHEVDTARQNEAQLIDTDLDGDTSDAGAQWVVGEQFASGTIKVDVVD